MILKDYKDKISWYSLSYSNDIQLLIENKSKICWELLSGNSNDNAIELLLENQDKINWTIFSTNPHQKAIKLLSENIDKIDWEAISENSGIFTYSYKKIKKDKAKPRII